MKQYLTSQGLQTLWNQIKALFVAKEAGKGLSSNDYTTAEKDKLAGVAAGAEVNTIVAVQRNGTAITPANRVVNILVPVKTSELNNDSTYQTAADVAETIVGVKLDLASGIITLTRKNGTTFTLDLPTEKIIKSGRYDSETEEIVLVLEDESEIRFSASELIDEYYADESTLELYTDTADGNKKKFRLKTAYKNKIDGSEQATNKTASVSASSTSSQYPTAQAVYNAVKDLATKVQTFSQATTRANIESGETISTVFGKIRKWFSDIKAVAFSGSYNDLSDTPSIGSLAKLESESSEASFADTQKIIASPSSGIWGQTSYSKTALMMWNYINSKIESVLGLTETNYNGTAAKATADGSGNRISSTYATQAALNNVFSNKYAAWQNSESNTPMWVNVGHVRLNGQSARYITTTFIAIQEYAGLENYAEFKVGAYWDGSKYTNLRLYFLQLNGFDTEEFKLIAKNYELMLYAKTSVQYAPRTLTITNDYQRPSLWTLNPWTTITQVNLPGGDAISTNEIVSTAFRKLSGCLELTDSNLATYFANGVLTIPNGVTTVIFNTSAVKTVYLVQGTVMKNGYRLTIGGTWQPDTNSDYQGLEGCFPYYVNYHYLGHTGSLLPNIDAYSHFADYVYFNGMWFSKMY